MSVLSAQSIRTNVYIYPFSERTVHENGMSYGLSASGYDLRIKDRLYLAPMEFALCTTLEELELPDDVQGILLDKSTWARQGLSMFNTKFEPGWRGYPTVEVVNLGRKAVEIPAGAPLCQMEFVWLDEPTEQAYAGKYQNQPNVPVRAMFEAQPELPGLF
jgi:dCTP deaminase